VVDLDEPPVRDGAPAWGCLCCGERHYRSLFERPAEFVTLMTRVLAETNG
jgi:hypothetical protein